MPRLSDDEAALLRGVCRAPADDLPRLVYADWLEEHGQGERAAFIRLQCEEARDHTDRSSAAWGRRATIRELLLAHSVEWFRELPRWVRNEVAGTTLQDAYHRGFIEGLRVVTSPFLTFGPRLLDTYPLRDLLFLHAGNLLLRLAACPSLGRLRKVFLVGENVGDEGAAVLAGSPHLGRLEELDLSMCRIGDRGAKALAGARWFGNLAKLTLRGNRLTLEGVRALVGSPFLGRRVCFDLSFNPHLQNHPYAVYRLLGDRVYLAE